jgi:hypothetical protein
VTKAKEYREFAEECLAEAEKAKSNKERERYLQLVHTWVRAAERLENPNVAIAEPVSQRWGE